MIKAKFHYASWFEAGRRQVRSWSATSFEPASITEFGFKESILFDDNVGLRPYNVEGATFVNPALKGASSPAQTFLNFLPSKSISCEGPA